MGRKAETGREMRKAACTEQDGEQRAGAVLDISSRNPPLNQKAGIA